MPFAALAVAAYALVSNADDDTPRTVLGVRLGMSPSMARDAFSPPGHGALSTEVGDDLVLSFRRAGDDGPLRSAKLEFHDGLLVALRGEIASDHPLVSGKDLRVSSGSLFFIEPAHDGYRRFSLLARGCPTHREEVERILASR